MMPRTVMTKMLKTGCLQRIQSNMFTTKDPVRLNERVKDTQRTEPFWIQCGSHRGRDGELALPLVEGTPIRQGS